MASQISCVLVRLFAIYYFLGNIYYFPVAIVSIGFTAHGQFDFSLALVFLNVIISILLFLKPNIVLIGLTRTEAEISADFEAYANKIQSIGIALIGLSFLLSGLKGLANFVIFTAAAQRPTGLLGDAIWGDFIGAVGGMILIAASGGVSKLFTWLRELRPQVDVDPDQHR